MRKCLVLWILAILASVIAFALEVWATWGRLWGWALRGRCFTLQ